MSEWTTIAELADTNPESLPANTDRDFRFRYIDLGSVDDGAIDWQSVQSISFKNAPSRARRVCTAGDALFGTVRPNLQSHGYIPEGNKDDVVASTGFTIIRAHEHVADGRYIFFSLLSDNILRQSINAAVGSNYPAVTDRDVRHFRVFAPPVEQQSKIADVLTSLDTQIQKTEALIAKLEKVKEGLLHDLLTRGIDANGQLRPSPEQAPELYKESPLGLIPREWQFATADQFCAAVADGTHDSPKPAAEGYPLATSKNLKQYGLDLTDSYLISKADYEQVIKRSWVEEGDILFGMIGTIGNPTALTHEQTLIAPKNVGIFRLGGDLIKSSFLLNHLGSRHLTNQIDKILLGSTQKFVGLGALKSLIIPTPSRAEMGRISSAINSINQKISLEKATLNKRKTQKTGLMDDLLTGRVRVTPLLDQAQATTPA